MKQHLKISGMTCEGCVSSVTQKLFSLEEVQDVSITLATGDVELEVQSRLSLKKLTDALPPKYTPLVESKSNDAMVKMPSKLKQLFPLFLIFVYLIAATFLLQKKSPDIGGFMYDFIGLFFMVFSFFKFLDYK